MAYSGPVGHTELIAQIASMLAAEGIALRGIRLKPCTAGGNNHVIQVEVDGRAMVAKRYYRHSSDSRDRLSAEYAFLDYAQKAGIGCVPRLVSKDDRIGVALYEFIDGYKLTPLDLTGGHIKQARDFFMSLNHPATRSLATHLPNASEACFSIAEQLDMVQGRIDRLSMIPATSDVDEQAIVFTAELRKQWDILRARVLAGSESRGLDPQSVLVHEDRCVSPSDFGFHNAIVTQSGKVIFIDFEYAGWDDPAKTISDFFSHPAVPVPFDHFEDFLVSALAFFPNARMLMERTRLMLPVFRIKWCCIMMNDFLPELLQRRKFADPSFDETVKKRAQLKKAQHLLRVIHC